MSEIINVWYLKTDEYNLVFDKVDQLIDVVKEEIEGCMCCLGDEISFAVEQGEMEQSQFDQLKEFES